MSQLLDLINEAETNIKFGTVTVTLKKAHGDITRADINKITQRKVSGNAEALTIIGSLLKLLSAAQSSGNLTFTIMLQAGHAAQLLTSEFSTQEIR